MELFWPFSGNGLTAYERGTLSDLGYSPAVIADLEKNNIERARQIVRDGGPDLTLTGAPQTTPEATDVYWSTLSSGLESDVVGVASGARDVFQAAGSSLEQIAGNAQLLLLAIGAVAVFVFLK